MSQENSEIIIYEAADGSTKIDVRLEDETVWLSQAQMATLFQSERTNITKHINNIFKTNELNEESNVKKLHIANADKPVIFYSLDMIISVGYRVNSQQGVQFRMWATKTIREYIVKGFVLNDDRLAGRQTNYFDELLERVRKIRTSESNFYEKVKAVFTTSIDYQSKSDDAKVFFGTVQNKFHYAITGLTAAELIVKRIDAAKPNMGLMHRKRERVTRDEAEIAKNYMEESELKRLELLVEQFLSFAELRTYEQKPMYMRDWTRKLDEFIRFNDKDVLTHAGKVSHEDMRQKVKSELVRFNTPPMLRD